MNADAVGMDLGGELSSPLAAVAQKRHISPFAMGLLGARAVESMPAMAKAAAQSGTRNGGKLTQAQLDARAQQRTEDDEAQIKHCEPHRHPEPGKNRASVRSHEYCRT